MLAALQTIENPALHLAVHMSMILSLREGEILGLQPSDLDFDAADGRGTMLAISLRSAYNLCNSTTEFRVLRVGGSIRVPKDSFDAWLYRAA